MPRFAAAQTGANWTYEGKTGPLVWGKLDPAYQACSKGHEQSPIDIRGAHLNKALQPLEFHLHRRAGDAREHGHGIVARVDPGSYMVAGGVRYQLVELDFHHPSEHPVKGKLTDMEVDLVHRSDDGKMAIVAVRLNQDRGFPNALLADSVGALAHQARHHRESHRDGERGRPAARRPRLLDLRGFAELTPPCTEGVRWFVFEQELSISREQLRAFANLFKVNTRAIAGSARAADRGQRVRQVSGFRFQVSGFRFQVSGFRFSMPVRPAA